LDVCIQLKQLGIFIDKIFQQDITIKMILRDGDWKLIVGCVGPWPDYYPIPELDEIINKQPSDSKNITAYIGKTEVYLYNIKSIKKCLTNY
jgi:hypothetical protein